MVLQIVIYYNPLITKLNMAFKIGRHLGIHKECLNSIYYYNKLII